ncbi:MAG: hypothetical protein PHQ03_07530, partial [Methylococcales bacterium]|nr:hypothetical protein [Methylococcales bacterium]
MLEEDEKRFNIIGMAEVDCLIYEEGFMGNDEALIITDKDGRHDSIKITKCSQIFIDDLTGNALKIESDNQEKSLSQRERTSLLHIIGCLLDAINGNQPFEKHQSIASEAELIAILVEKYSEYH